VAQNGFATAKGRFGKFRIVSAKLDPVDLDGSFVAVEVDVASIDSGIGWRDAHLRSPEFFDVEQWPTARVRVHHAEPAGEPRHYRAQFDTSIRDVARTLPGSFELVSEDPLVVAGELVLDRTEFGVGPAPRSWNPFDVDAEVRVLFRATLETEAGASAPGD
jgi:polyisoprenoid-binding protein YceI